MHNKILYITNGISGAAGLERVLSVKASYLADNRGYDIHILALNDDCKSPFYKFSSRIKFHTIICTGNPSFYFYQYVLGLRKIVKQINPDLISVCDDGLKGLLFPLWIGQKKCPVIYERHVSKQVEFDGVSRFLVNKIKNKLMERGSTLYDRFIVLTTDNLLEWNQTKRIQVIPNPLSFYPNVTSNLKTKRIIAVGRLSYQKGYERLLLAWQILQPEFPDWSVCIYGKENDGGKLKNLIQGIGLQDTFKILSPTIDIEKEYLKSSIFALSSRFEGFGMVLTEAMACGLPCISFDCPCGPKDIIQDNVDGFLVPNDNITEFADKLRLLMIDPALRKRMGGQGRHNVQRYNIENIGNQWDCLFTELIKSYQ